MRAPGPQPGSSFSASARLLYWAQPSTDGAARELDLPISRISPAFCVDATASVDFLPYSALIKHRKLEK